jgi:hypothetical protein
MILPLKIPWYQKWQAEPLEAVYQSETKLWFIPDEANEELLNYERWFPVKNADLILPGPPILFSAPLTCQHCHYQTIVFGLGTDGAYTRSHSPDEWIYDFEWGHIGDIREVDKRLARQLKKHCPNYYPDREKYSRLSYWTNHCDHCGKQISEYFLNSYDNSTAFCPPDREAARNVDVIELEPECFTFYRATRSNYWGMYYLYVWANERN